MVCKVWPAERCKDLPPLGQSTTLSWLVFSETAMDTLVLSYSCALGCDRVIVYVSPQNVPLRKDCQLAITGVPQPISLSNGPSIGEDFQLRLSVDL